MNRVLVTGAGGFVGANLVRRLLEREGEVTALVRPGADLWRLEGVPLGVVEGDVRDEEAVRAAVRKARPDTIFHLAANGAYSWQQDSRSIFETNVLGTIALVEAALELECDAFVHAGSSSEYGFKDHAPGEDEALEPNSDYAVSKAAATLYCCQRARASGRRLVTLRLYAVYGPWEDPRRLLPTLIERGLAGELPPLVRSDIARDFIYVDDAVDALLLAAERGHPGAVYNVGTGRQTTIGELVAIAREELAIGVEPEWETERARSWDTSVWVSDPQRIRAELGWEAATPLSAGFRRTVEWHRARTA